MARDPEQTASPRLQITTVLSLGKLGIWPLSCFNVFFVRVGLIEEKSQKPKLTNLLVLCITKGKGRHNTVLLCLREILNRTVRESSPL